MSAHAIPHDSGTLHVTGGAGYVDDLALPANTVHLAFGLSTCASGEITALDLKPVRASKGVIAVLTHKDLPGDNDTSPSPYPEPLLAEGEVHYIGQPIFLVVASSHITARRAARAAKITYAERAPILSVADALKAKSYFEPPLTWQRDDPAPAIIAAPHSVEGQIETGAQEHFYLEGQAALAIPGEGDMHVIASTQHPSEIQHKVAHALNLPFAHVRVENRRVGGGFGGKESQGNALAVACAVVAQRLNRPARMRYDRDDDFLITGKRHPFRITYRAGFDDQGRLTGIEFGHYIACGWSLDLSLAVCDRAMLHADNCYFLPRVAITSHRLRTNTQSATAFRGFGGPQGMVGIERVMDHIAHHLGLDPLAVRRANLYGQGRETTPYGMQVEDNIAPELIDRLVVEADYEARRKAIHKANAMSPTIKRGIALTPVKFGISFTLSHLNQAGALVHVYTDGSVHLNHGGTEMGQGLHTKVAQVAARAFALPVRAVRITATDTGKVPNTSATAASSGADMNGMAVQAACQTIRARLVEFAAARWKVAAADIRFQGGKVVIGTKRITFAELAQAAHQARISLSSTGYYATPKLHWDRMQGKGRPFLYFAYGAAVTEVAIDTATGENRILRVDILHDCGRSLNPAIDLGQIEGGYVQGAGWLTTEELVWDEKGALRTHAPSTYKIPACSDRPPIFNVSFWEGDNREATIHRSKAVGEPPLMLGISALMALSDAINQCGGAAYPALSAPATAERILRTISAAKGEAWE